MSPGRMRPHAMGLRNKIQTKVSDTMLAALDAEALRRGLERATIMRRLLAVALGQPELLGKEPVE